MILRFFAIADFAFFFTGYNKVDLPTNPPAPWLAVKPSVCVGGGGDSPAYPSVNTYWYLFLSFVCVNYYWKVLPGPPNITLQKSSKTTPKTWTFPLSSIYCTVWSRSIRLYIYFTRYMDRVKLFTHFLL